MRMRILVMLLMLAMSVCGTACASSSDFLSAHATVEYMLEHAAYEGAKEGIKDMFNLPGDTVKYVIENPEESYETAKSVFNYPGDVAREVFEHKFFNGESIQ